MKIQGEVRRKYLREGICRIEKVNDQGIDIKWSEDTLVSLAQNHRSNASTHIFQGPNALWFSISFDVI